MRATLLLRFAVLPLILPIVLSACGQSNRNTEQPTEAVVSSVPLVLVNESAITERQLQHQVDSLLGEQAALFGGPEIREKILEGMITSRAMALLKEPSLSEEEKQVLDLKVAAYREELLVKQYVQENATPTPVSLEVVKQYYQEHTLEFGGLERKTVEIVETTGVLNRKQRETLIAEMGRLDMNASWESEVLRMSGSGLPVRITKATVNAEVLDTPLKELVGSTTNGSVSSLHDGTQLIKVKVTDTQVLPPQPLATVSGTIRKKLAPVMLKQAIKSLSENVKKQVTIIRK